MVHEKFSQIENAVKRGGRSASSVGKNTQILRHFPIAPSIDKPITPISYRGD
jgi:hypothetical protein